MVQDCTNNYLVSLIVNYYPYNYLMKISPNKVLKHVFNNSNDYSLIIDACAV